MCRPGERITFRFRSTSLHIDPDWLEYIPLEDVFEAYGPACPAGPVDGIALYFKPNVLPLIGAPADLGKPYFFLTVKTPTDKELEETDSFPSTRVRPPDSAGPWVEDVTRLAFDPKDRRPSDRVYLLHYPGTGGDRDRVRVSCGGVPNEAAGRYCFTTPSYLYKRELRVSYRYQQDHLAIADSERAAVLEFDVRLRAWLDELARDLGGQK
jgi:hypothetical protein